MEKKIMVVDSKMIKIGDNLNGYSIVGTMELRRNREIAVIGVRADGARFLWVVATMEPDADYWHAGDYPNTGAEAWLKFARYAAPTAV